MNKNYLNDLFVRCWQHIMSKQWMRNSAMVLLLLLMGAMTNNAMAKRFTQDEVWMELDWRSDLSAFEVKVHAVDWNGANAGMDKLYLNFYNEDNGKWYEIAQVYGDKDDDGYVTIYRKNSGLGHRIWTSSQEVTTERKYGGTDRTFYIYMPQNLMFQDAKIHARWDIDIEAAKDHHGGWFEAWKGRTDLINFKTQLSNVRLSDTRDELWVDYNTNNLSVNEHTCASIYLQYSRNGRDWSDWSGDHNVTKSFTKYASGWSKGPNNTAMTRQEFANGVYLRVFTDIHPRNGESHWHRVGYSNNIHTGSTAVMKSDKLGIVQDSRNITLSWEILKPTQETSSQDMNDFEVQRKVDGEWIVVDEVDFSTNKTAYTYTYHLSDEECNNGNVEYEFRVWKKKFANANTYREYMTASCPATSINTDYDKIEITSVEPIGGTTTARVSWKNVGGGVWDKDAAVELFYNENSMTVSYDESEATIESLIGCTEYSVKIKRTALGNVNTSKPKEFVMPNNSARAIKKLQVSKGYFNNAVELSWEVPSDSSDFKYFDIVRTPLLGGESVSLSQMEHLGLTRYAYRDNQMDAGVLYTYTVNGYAECTGDISLGDSKSSTGFSQPYAVVSGRVAYKGSQGVEGVTISAIGGDEVSTNKSLLFQGGNSNVALPAKLADFNDKDQLTFQTWIKPNTSDAELFIFSKGSTYDLKIGRNHDGSASITLYLLGQFIRNAATIPFDTWSHLSWTLDLSDDKTSAATKLYVNGELVDSRNFINLSQELLNTHRDEKLMMGTNSGKKDGFAGNLEDIRFWNKVLTAEEIAFNYNAFLSGKESGLAAYYRCDEKGSTTELFDYSAVGSVFNKNDGEMENTMLVQFSDNVPSADQLSVKTKTDIDGNYLINTLPYTSEGVQYSIVPSLGIHEFNPNKRTVYTSPLSTIFNGVDFEDVSSFPVSGTVYYEGTDVPMAGANLYVDGIICSKDGSLITTAEDGTYEIEVPIGDHFIEIKKDGHVFKDNGRYPADPNDVGIKFTFEEEMRNLTFYDNTLVPVVGRVVGGKIETEKPIGFGESVNNIGKATLKLSSGNYRLNVVNNTNGTTSSIDANDQDVAVASSSSDVNSNAYRKGGNAEEVKYIYITTDPLTGEFSAMLPPLAYTIADVSINSNANIRFDNLPNINATDPLKIIKDSIITEEGVTKRFEYAALTKLTYTSKPVLIVTDKGNSDGAFGSKETYLQTLGVTDTVQLYNVENDAVRYAFDNPIFVQDQTYQFSIVGYEDYYNYDNTETVEYRMPLSGTVVTISNEMSSVQSVYVEDGTVEGNAVSAGQFVELKDNSLTLDSTGCAVYQWKAGFPNITAPYSLGLNIKYSSNSQDYVWREDDPFRGVVFGELPSGNNFVTSGPDKIMMILRDPAGSGSAAFWEKGTTKTFTETYTGSFLHSSSMETVTKFGVDQRVIIGTPGTGTIEDLESDNDFTVGVNMSTSHSGGNEVTNTITTTKRISTSDSPDYVGAGGDVFVGTATNLLFGAARNVGPKKEGDVYKLNLHEVITMGSEFGTAFSYTQNYIENILIPNFYKNRNALLTQAESQDFIDNFENNTEENVYLTLLSEDDANYGEAGTYKMVVPATVEPDSCYSDKVAWNTQQALAWISQLEQNEKVKVKAINERDKYLKENYSFDQGALIESSETTDSAYTSIYSGTWSMEAVLGSKIGFSVKGTGVDVVLNNNTGTQSEWSDATTTQETTTTGFTLADDGFNDALTVDVFDAPDGFGSIFVTRGGQTSCPYEDAAVTKYYKPGTEISAATMQIEVPKAEIMNSFATDVPSGSAATYTIQLRNESETGDDVWFDLKVIDASNPNGASISMDGSAFNEGKARTIIVPAGANVEKTIQLKQTRKDVLNYEDIALVLASQCQGDPTGIFPVIADTVYLSAQFVSSSSPITLEIEERTMNMFTSDTLELVMKDIDRSFDNFKSVYLQYKKEGDVDWTLGRDWAISDENDADSKELLPDGGRIAVQFPMSNKALFPDGKYEFRLQTKSTFGSEGVTNKSEVITIIKDMVRPQALRTPSPSDGILSAGEDVAILFNEDIRSGELTAANNFIVTAILNDADIAHDVALRLDGTASAVAQTEADVHLANTSFSMDMWLKYAQAGTVIEHGTANNKFVVSITDAGKLSVTMGAKTIVSEDAIPADKWCFLTMCYDVNGGLFTALAANDASDIELFSAIPMGTYNGVGSLSIGAGMIGAMHEITLWNKARSVAEAKMEMYQNKAASTPNLIGYWKLNEGHGIIGRDIARNRHFTLANETWALNNKNIAAQLGDNAYLNLNISTCSASENDSYAMEMWFRGAAQTNATLWSVGGERLAIGFNANGKLALTLNGTSAQVSADNYLDEVWHHVALNVLRNGTATVYVDGENVYQTPAETVPALQDAFLTIGANRMYAGGATYNYENNFKGEVDEIRFWNARLTGEYLNNNRYARLDVDNVSGLAAYYTFEKESLDGANQVVTSFTLEDFSENKVGDAAQVAVVSSDNAPALQAASTLTNIQYSNVASEREIVLNIEEQAYLVEGTTVNFTVRDVRDVNNNLSQPITWSAFVNQNRLIWSEDAIALEQKDGAGSEFVVSIGNQSGVTENWTIFNMPAWLSASQTDGRLAPQQNTEIQFQVSSSLPLGSYEEVIYLSGNEGINVPLVISVNVLAEKPDWKVADANFESSMNMIGQLKIKDVLSYNPNDIIAAFVGEICVGIASPAYQSRYDGYYIYLNVGGNAAMNNKAIDFKVWEAATGIIYPMVVTENDLVYRPNLIEGNLSSPIVWNAADMIEQRTTFTSGWNWMSIYVKPTDENVSSVMASVEDKTSLVKDKTSFALYNNSDWQGTLSAVEVGKMYSVNMNSEGEFALVGSNLDDDTEVAVNEGWNWLGYTASFNTNLGDAFADLNPQDGDFVKSKNAFAMYQGYEWIGSLTALQPGKGYMYLNNADQDKSFSYPSKPSVSSRMRSAMRSAKSSFTPVDDSQYPSNMTIYAVVKDGEDILAGADVAVFAGEECRTAQVADANGYVYLTIPGESEGAKLTFKVVAEGKTYSLDYDLKYVDDAILGNIEKPYEINVSSPSALNDVIARETSIYPSIATDEVNIDTEMKIELLRIYNAAGVLVYQDDAPEMQVLVSGFTLGFYSIQIIAEDGEVWSGSFIKK